MFSLFMVSCFSGPRGLPNNLIEDFKKKHSDVYRVYNLGEDRDLIHDHLANIYVGDALTDAYILHYQTIRKMTDDETAIDVRQVDYSSVDFKSHTLTGVILDVDWSVGGIVTHQDHKHTRVNRYQAGYTLQQDDEGDWKIARTRVRNAERVQRAFLSDDEFFDGVDAGGGYLDPLDLLDGGLLEDEP